MNIQCVYVKMLIIGNSVSKLRSNLGSLFWTIVSAL